MIGRDDREEPRVDRSDPRDAKRDARNEPDDCVKTCPGNIKWRNTSRLNATYNIRKRQKKINKKIP